MFSDDIIAQFLYRLPLKSVFRFKCVSKSWNSLISEPYLKRNYQLRSQGVGPSACGFFYYDRTDDEDESLGWAPQPAGPARFLNLRYRDDQTMSDSFDFIDKLGHVVAYCKGLLLLTSPPKARVGPCYFVCDPVTRKHVALPPTLDQYMYIAHGLLCEEDGHYKVVVCTNALLYRDVIKIETYSSETGQWNKSLFKAASKFCLRPYCVAQVMGKILYWWETGGRRLMAYDPNDPKQRGMIIELPLGGHDEEYPDERIIYHASGISETKEGHLQYYRAELFIEIFVLNESSRRLYNTHDVIGHGRWNLIHKINIYNNPILEPYDDVGCLRFSPLDPQCFLLRTTDKQLLSYDCSNGKIDQICSFDFYGHEYYVFYQHPLWPFLC